MSILRLGKLLRERRGDRGIREVAAEIAVSPATLSRVERGQLPDIVTFSKVCTWLRIDPSEVLDIPKASRSAPPSPNPERVPAVHFRANVTLTPEAASDLAILILAAQQEMVRREADAL